MNIESLLQLGFAGGIATYLVIWVTKRQDGKLDTLISIQERIVKILEEKK